MVLNIYVNNIETNLNESGINNNVNIYIIQHVFEHGIYYPYTPINISTTPILYLTNTITDKTIINPTMVFIYILLTIFRIWIVINIKLLYSLFNLIYIANGFKILLLMI